jgi:hypothetical protein
VRLRRELQGVDVVCIEDDVFWEFLISAVILGILGLEELVEFPLRTLQGVTRSVTPRRGLSYL